MQFGKDIGKKFYEDGQVRRYPGNTVVADILPGCSAYAVMLQLRRLFQDSGLADHYILLPEDSYHMTVIRGLNDQVRTEDYWPVCLPVNCSMEAVDDHVSAAIARTGLPGPLRMRFDAVHAGASCFVVHLTPEDEAENRKLRDFRDRAAAEIGIKLPGHDSYRFHMSLGYTRIVPEGAAQTQLEALTLQMNALLHTQPAFTTGAPYMAYYDNMYAFSKCRISRDTPVY